MIKKVLFAAGLAGCLLCAVAASTTDEQTGPARRTSPPQEQPVVPTSKPAEVRLSCDLDPKNFQFEMTQKSVASAAHELSDADGGQSLAHRESVMRKIVCDTTRRPIVRWFALDAVFETMALEKVLKEQASMQSPWVNSLTGSIGSVALVNTETKAGKTCSVVLYGTAMPVISTSSMILASVRFCRNPKDNDWVSDAVIGHSIVQLDAEQLLPPGNTA